MMKKSLIALAVLAASGSAFAGNVDLSGKARVAIQKTDATNAKTQMVDYGSRLIVSGKEDLGGGMNAFFHQEMNIDVADGTEATDGVDDGPFSTRQTYVGVAGSFGKVLAGNAYAPYKLIGTASVFEDTPGDTVSDTSGAAIFGNGHDAQYAQALAYITPDYNGFHAALALTNAGTATADVSNSQSLALVYANGPLTASYGYEKQGDDSLGGANMGSKASKINLGYKMGDLGLKATYESIDKGSAYARTYVSASTANASTTTAYSAADQDSWMVSVTYGMGPITLAAQYGDKDVDGATSTDLKHNTVGAMYNLSKRTQVYVAYDTKNYGTGGTDVNAWAVGLNHDF